ncbi:MAG: SAM-dependent methyltransferase, partial [Hyphomicrobiales bacterium]|nr:SAM-dependent methyltransferase [Hyphomicrobiales bacterium]
PVSVETFMDCALGDPTFGYYMTRDPFGAAGDFVTAPEISQMFGELLGVWTLSMWAALGAPRRLRLVELGPGRGTLMADLLRALSIAPEIFEALDVRMVETSPSLRRAQQASLAGASAPVQWHERIEDVPGGPAIFVANEFFDALPVRQYVRAVDGWRERMVTHAHDGGFAFTPGGRVEPSLRVEAETGAVLEIAARSHAAMAALGRRVAREGGALLAIDYGHSETAIGETLQAVRAHRFVDPLAEPGLADLTAHVDFAALARTARASGCKTFGPVTQGAFLRELGIGERAQSLMRGADEGQRRGILAALRRLVGSEPGEMGALFKAFCATQPGLAAPPGFEAT